MAREERKKEDLLIKEKRRAKNFFVTSSAKMSDDKGVSKTAISSSVFTKMSQSFADGEYLLDDAIREPNASILYMLQEMQADIDDVYNEVSASAFQASFFPFARIESGSFGVVSSSLVPDKDSKYDLGSSGKEWNDLFIDGTANIDSLAMGVTVNAIKDEDNMSSNSNTSLATQQSIKAYVDANAGGGGGSGNYDTGSHLVPHADNTYDLGGSKHEWRNLYVDGIAYIDNGQIGSGTFTGDVAASLLGINGIVHLEKSPTTITQNGVLDARSKNLFILNNKVEITGILGGGITGQIVTVISLGSNVAHHAEKTVTSTSQIQFPLNRDLTFRGPVAHQFIYGGSYWIRLV